jgi:hypothetical protein
MSAAAPPTAEEGLAVRWPAKADADEMTFEGDRFVALSSAPDVSKGAFSVAAWVQAADLAGGNLNYGRGIARSTRDEKVGDWLISVHPDGRLRFINWRQAGDDKTGSHVTRKPVVAPEAWHHVVAVWDGKTNRLYVNGAEAPYDDGTTATGWGTGHEVGRGWTQPGYYWNGMIADLRVYGRALTAAEVAAGFKAGPPACRTAPPPSRRATPRSARPLTASSSPGCGRRRSSPRPRPTAPSSSAA